MYPALLKLFGLTVYHLKMNLQYRPELQNHNLPGVIFFANDTGWKEPPHRLLKYLPQDKYL